MLILDSRSSFFPIFVRSFCVFSADSLPNTTNSSFPSWHSSSYFDTALFTSPFPDDSSSFPPIRVKLSAKRLSVMVNTSQPAFLSSQEVLSDGSLFLQLLGHDSPHSKPALSAAVLRRLCARGIVSA